MGPVEIKGLTLAAAMLIGGMCIFLGYRLYVKGVLEKGQVDAGGGGWRVVLKDYGPGVVFALFGAAIIIFSVTRTLTSNTTTTKRQIQTPVVAPPTPTMTAPTPAATLPTPGTRLPSETKSLQKDTKSPVVIEESVTTAESASATAGEEPKAAAEALDTRPRRRSYTDPKPPDPNLRR